MCVLRRWAVRRMSDRWEALASAGLLLLMAAAARAEDAAAVVPLARGHAHNDYWHPRPLEDALALGFCSVEADVFLRPEGLLVGHDPTELKPQRTLEALYLEPLRQRARRHGGRIYPDGPPFSLMIDVKSSAEETYQALDRLLARYDDLVTRYEDGIPQVRAVNVILSGNRARETIARQKVRYVAIDGRPEDLEANPPATLVPWISANWTLLFAWRGEGPFPDAERRRLTELVARAHAQGRQVRFWATPERELLWQALLAAGVDRINTDHLEKLAHFLRAQKTAPAGTRP